jgi:lipoprotein-releasing system permease protein
MYRWFLVYRYLFSRFVSFAALLVVASSVALLIVIVSVMEGFRSELKQRVRGTSSDLKVESTRHIGLEDPEQLAARLAKVPGVKATAPYTETLVLYTHESGFGATRELDERYLRVVDVENEPLVGEFEKYIRACAPAGPEWPRDLRAALSPEWAERGLWDALSGGYGTRSPPLVDGELPSPVLVGLEHWRWFVRHGHLIRLTAYSPGDHTLKNRVFLVVGFFKTGLYEMDSRGIVMEKSVAADFLGIDSVASGVRIAAEPEFTTTEGLQQLRGRVEKAIDEAGVLFTRTMTWEEEKATLLRAVRIEKTIVSVVLGIVVLFSGFMVFIILAVQVVEKTRDLGVLQSMGVSSTGIARIFCLLGCLVCISGTIIGTIYGVGFSLAVNTIQRWTYLITDHEVFPRQVFYMDEIPVRFEPFDLGLIIIPMVITGLLASLLPALRAARKDPVIALRYE